MVFDALVQQVVPATWESFGVWIPLTFGLSVGLAYVIVSAIRHRKPRA